MVLTLQPKPDLEPELGPELELELRNLKIAYKAAAFVKCLVGD
jgi:hypothetical protein